MFLEEREKTIPPALCPEQTLSSAGTGQTLPTLFRLEFLRKGIGTGLGSERHP